MNTYICTYVYMFVFVFGVYAPRLWDPDAAAIGSFCPPASTKAGRIAGCVQTAAPCQVAPAPANFGGESKAASSFSCMACQETDSASLVVKLSSDIVPATACARASTAGALALFFFCPQQFGFDSRAPCQLPGLVLPCVSILLFALELVKLIPGDPWLVVNWKYAYCHCDRRFGCACTYFFPSIQCQDRG